MWFGNALPEKDKAWMAAYVVPKPDLSFITDNPFTDVCVTRAMCTNVSP